MIYKLFIRTNLIWGLLPVGDAVPPDDLLLADEGVIAGDLKNLIIRNSKIDILRRAKIFIIKIIISYLSR